MLNVAAMYINLFVYVFNYSFDLSDAESSLFSVVQTDTSISNRQSLMCRRPYLLVRVEQTRNFIPILIRLWTAGVFKNMPNDLGARMLAVDGQTFRDLFACF